MLSKINEIVFPCSFLHNKLLNEDFVSHTFTLVQNFKKVNALGKLMVNHWILF